jgi:peptide/nickel transport system permease protein
VIEYIVKRLLWGLFVVFAVLTIVFFVINGIGDPARSTLGPNAGPQQIAAFKRRHGFDEPILAQYGSWLGVIPCVREGAPEFEHGERCGLLQGNLQESLQHQDSVTATIGYRLPRTLLLGTMALLFELLLGLFVGVMASLRKGSWFDTGFMSIAFLGISLPSYVTGPIFLLTLAGTWGLFPVGGYGVGFWDHVYHGLLPAFTLAILGAAQYARVMRNEMIETMRMDFIRTAHAKGVPERKVVLRHGLRNALLPIVTMIGLSMPTLVSGAIISEVVFAWPGMGSLAIQSITGLDVFTVMGVVLIFAVMVQIGNLLADIAVAQLDPRVRLGAETNR